MKMLNKKEIQLITGGYGCSCLCSDDTNISNAFDMGCANNFISCSYNCNIIGNFTPVASFCQSNSSCNNTDIDIDTYNENILTGVVAGTIISGLLMTILTACAIKQHISKKRPQNVEKIIRVVKKDLYLGIA